VKRFDPAQAMAAIRMWHDTASVGITKPIGQTCRQEKWGYFADMSTVAEIESAIEKLPPTELRELLAWIEDYQAMVGASQTLFAIYDEEEEQARGKS
jgi:hypothetical protein